MTRFDTKRAFIQGLGRVGRYGEEERRFVLEGLNPVSSIGEKAIKTKLVTAKAALMKKVKPAANKNKNKKKPQTPGSQQPTTNATSDTMADKKANQTD